MEALKSKASTAFQSGSYDSSIELYTEAISLNPTNESLYASRSLAYLNKGQFVFALRDAKKCIELSPHSPQGYFRKGQAFEKLLHYTSACEAYDAGLANCPNDPELANARKVLADLDNVLNYSRPAETPESDRYVRLVQWLKEGGAKLPRLHLKYYSDDYRGVHALGDIQADEVVLYVPLRMIMTSEVARASPIGVQITQANIELRSKHSYLAAYLLEERAKGEASPWAPYINTLPTKFANVPLFFTEPELGWLQGSFTLNKIADRVESLAAEYDTLCRALPAFRAHSYADFVWARLAVITRIFGLQVGGVKTDGLVPYADMLNHKLPRYVFQKKTVFFC
jgi:histone-lysine N-methyltransferase SETD3